MLHFLELSSNVTLHGLCSFSCTSGYCRFTTKCLPMVENKMASKHGLLFNIYRTYLSILAICLLAPLLHVRSDEGFFTVTGNDTNNHQRLEQLHNSCLDCIPTHSFFAEGIFKQTLRLQQNQATAGARTTFQYNLHFVAEYPTTGINIFLNCVCVFPQVKVCSCCRYFASFTLYLLRNG